MLIDLFHSSHFGPEAVGLTCTFPVVLMKGQSSFVLEQYIQLSNVLRNLQIVGFIVMMELHEKN